MINVDVTNGRLVVTDHWPGDEIYCQSGRAEDAKAGAVERARTSDAATGPAAASPERQAVSDWYARYDLSIEQVLDTLAGALDGLVSLQDICPHNVTIRQQAEPDVGLSALTYCDVCGAVIGDE